MTKRLYFEDPYQTEFEAFIARRVDWQGKPGLILDQTCFYPTSGGQGCDKGFLNDVPVVDVLENEDEILHLVTDGVKAKKVHGRISWKRRFDFMQQHSGQHVLSQAVLSVLGADTVSSHLGEESSTIEIAKADLTNEEVTAAEDLAIKIIFENRPIKTYFVPANQLVSIPLRKIPFQREQLRIVEVEGFDYSACGGTHCSRTGEIGLVKVGHWERIRNNVRFHFLCGNRAIADYKWKSQMIEDLAENFSAKGADVLELVNKQVEENKELRQALKGLSQQVIDFEGDQLLAKAVPCGEIKVVQAIFNNRSVEELKALAKRITDLDRTVVLFGNKADKGQLTFACSEGLTFKMNDFLRDACTILGGRGGGSPGLAFGGGPLVQKVDEAVQSAFKRIIEFT
jgi:alanyl-tRNA synthetase